MATDSYTVERLQREIAWDRVIVDEEFWGSGDDRERLGVFRILPTNPNWPEIRIVCDPIFTCIEQVEFSCWDNYYFQEYQGGLDGAVGFVASLVRGELLLGEELDEDGKCCIAGFFEPGERVDLGSRRGVTRRVIQFNREPIVERIPGR